MSLNSLEWSTNGHISLMILVNDAKYIHVLSIFSTSASPFTLQVIFHKFIRILFILLQMLINLFSSNRIIDMLDNLNKYISVVVLNIFKNFLKWFVFIYSLSTVIACIACMRMKSCSKILHTLVTVMNFTDRN